MDNPPYEKFLTDYLAKRDAIVTFLDSEGATFADYEDLFHALDDVIESHVFRPKMPLDVPLKMRAKLSIITAIVDPA